MVPEANDGSSATAPAQPARNRGQTLPLHVALVRWYLTPDAAAGTGIVAGMRAIVQRVTQARVTVGDEVTGEIGHGLCVLVGVTHHDTESHARKLADKLWKLRVFSDEDDRMNLSVADVGGEILLVSQFTLYADARKGNRPSYVQAARPEHAEPLINFVGDRLQSLGVRVATGRFGADMNVELLNQGPVTISLEL